MRINTKNKKIVLKMTLLASAILFSQPGMTATSDKVHAFFADEHNTTPTTPTGNRVLEIDIENMQLVNSLDFPGLLNHHADNTFDSKIYGVPKGSGFVNVVKLSKDENGTTSLNLDNKIDLIHQPRSADAYNQKLGVVLMTARNRPMGSFIDVKTDKVLGTIGENVDCTLTTGGKLLSQPNPNSIENATAYQCKHTDFGGDQISGHPYWLTTDYAAIVDRSNRQISVYKVWRDGNKIKSKLVNHLKTRTSIHQIVPRDRTALPRSQQADFYAIEEGSPAQDIAPSLLKLKLTTKGLILEKRVELGRNTRYPDKHNQGDVDSYITEKCSTYSDISNDRVRSYYFKRLFSSIGLRNTYKNQDYTAKMPVECFNPRTQGAHNADFAPDNKHLYIGSREGHMFIIDVNKMLINRAINTGSGYGQGAGSGHTTFSASRNLGIVTNHTAPYMTVIDTKNQKKIKDIPLPFTRENIFSAVQSHTGYIDDNEKYYYNFWTDGGVYYQIDLDTLDISNSLYTGGIPIQGSYISLSDIETTATTVPFVVNFDSAQSNGNAVTIDVLANDTGTGLNIDYVDPGYNGQTKIVNGAIEYTPVGGFSGTDEFWYTVIDDSGKEKWGLVTVQVESSIPPGGGSALKAFSDTAVSDGSPVTIDVLKNDTGSDLTLGWVDQPYNGKNEVVNGTVIYTPNADFTGTDEFWYEVLDKSGNSAWGQVTVAVNGSGTPDSPFQANDDTATINSGETIVVDVTANDSGNGISVATVEEVSDGVTGKQGNKVVYQSPAGFVGVVEVWYKLVNSENEESWAKVTITVNPD